MESEVEAIQRLLTDVLERRLGPLEESLKVHRTLIESLASHVAILKAKQLPAIPRRTPSIDVSRTPRASSARRSIEVPQRSSTPTGDRKRLMEEHKKKAEEDAVLKREKALQKAAEDKQKKEALQKKKEEEAAKKAEERKQKELADKEAKRLAAEEKKKREDEKKHKEEERKRKELADKESKRLAAEEKKRKDEERKQKDLEDKRSRVDAKRQALEDKKKKEPSDKLRPDSAKSSKKLNTSRSAEVSEASIEEVKTEEPAMPELVQENPVFVIEEEEVKLPPPQDDKETQLLEVESELAQLTAVRPSQSYDEATLNASPAFELTIGSRSALSLLRDMSNEKLYLASQPSTDVVWAFRLFHQFRGVTLPLDEVEAWAYCQNYMTKGRSELGD